MGIPEKTILRVAFVADTCGKIRVKDRQVYSGHSLAIGKSLISIHDTDQVGHDLLRKNKRPGIYLVVVRLRYVEKFPTTFFYRLFNPTFIPAVAIYKGPKFLWREVLNPVYRGGGLKVGGELGDEQILV